MDGILRDVQHALRAFARRKVVAVGVVSSLAIAISANTAVFGIANTLLLKTVAGVTRTDRLVEISRTIGGNTSDVTFPMFRHLRAQAAVLEDLAALALESVSFSAGGEPAVRGGLIVTGNYFSILGVRAARGRLFNPTEGEYPAVAPMAIITHDVWQREFGGADDVIGRTARVNGTAVQVVGVLPPGFAGHHTGLLVDIYLPLGLVIPGLPDPTTFARGTESSLELLGRLRVGVTTTQATRALGASADAFARQIGESTARHPYAVQIDAWGPLPATVRGPVAVFLLVLFVLVALALSMACINVTTILLAQASERQRELAVRRAMGASERRLARQLVTETAVLFVAAGIVGVAVAAWAAQLIGGIEPPVPVPGRIGADFGVDRGVLIFSLALTLAAALVFSLPPALHASRFDLSIALREGRGYESKAKAGLRSGLIGVQVAITCLLLTGTLLFGRALVSMRALDLGWNGDGVFVSSLDFELSGTAPSSGLVKQAEILARLSSDPAVEVAALATKLPGGGRSSFGLVSVPGVQPPDGLPGFDAALNRVSAGYFQSMRIPLLRGRDISATDDDRSQRVAVVNATMARRLWGDADPVGRSFFVVQPQRRLEFRVIGVVRDARPRAARSAAENFYYVPASQWYNSQPTLHVRARPGRESAAAAAIRPAVAAVDPALVVSSVRPLNEALEIFLLPQRLAAWVSAIIGVFALLLAVVGVYGVTAFLVTRRAREVAIRLALGATNGDVVRLLVRQGARAPLIGAVIGSVLAAGAAFAAGKVVGGTRVGDPVTIVGVPVLIATIVGAAMMVPLRRMVRGSPMASLRE